jgi:hypothetical protein
MANMLSSAVPESLEPGIRRIVREAMVDVSRYSTTSLGRLGLLDRWLFEGTATIRLIWTAGRGAGLVGPWRSSAIQGETKTLDSQQAAAIG